MSTVGELARERAGIQRRVLAVLAAALVLGGLGLSGAITAGGLLAAEVSGNDAASGLAQTAVVLGGAGLALPLARLSSRYGRRVGLTCGYGLGLGGAGLAVLGAGITSFPVLLVGLSLFGGSVAAGLQARFSATDLSAPDRVSRDLSIVLWMTTVGVVIGPNLAEPAAGTARWLGLAPLSGMFIWSGVGFALAALLLATLLRPDPLLLARRLDDSDRDGGATVGARAALGTIRRSPPAALAFTAVVLAHATMVGLMVMTPLHLNRGGAGLAVVGVVISAHVAGMYLFSPLVGALADAVGRLAVIASGAVIMALAGLLAAAAPGDNATTVGAALFLLGLGWSCCMVAGSSLLTSSVAVDERPGVQGTTDMSMGLAAATAGALAGIVFSVWSFAILAVLVAAMITPVVAVTLHQMRTAPA